MTEFWTCRRCRVEHRTEKPRGDAARYACEIKGCDVVYVATYRYDDNNKVRMYHIRGGIGYDDSKSEEQVVKATSKPKECQCGKANYPMETYCYIHNIWCERTRLAVMGKVR